MERNILLTIRYDGTDFSGWQIQPDARTVQGEIRKALEKICGMKIKLDGTSRTDAGVHALGQRASFKGDFGIPTDRMLPVLNAMLPEDIQILGVEEKEPEFHARFNSKGKKYIYKIMNCADKDVFRRNHYYFYDRKLDVDRMKEAAGFIEGTHDFRSFMAMGSTPQETTVRTVYECSVDSCSTGPGEELITVTVRGDGFLYNMVRIIVGTLIEVGLGKKAPEDIPGIIDSCDRSRAGRTAPARGLYLAEIYFSEEDLIERR